MSSTKYEGGDQQLLLDIKSSKNEAWKYMYLQYQPMVIGIAIKNSGGVDQGEDLFQETLIDFRQNIIQDKVRDSSNIKNYIYTIALNRWRVSLRKKGIEQPSEIIDDKLFDDSVDISFDENEYDILEELKLVLEKISVDCKKLIAEKYSMIKKSMVEIANLLGYNDSRAATVKLNKCMTKARELGKEVLRSKE